MKIRISNNMGDISGDMVMEPEEVSGKMGIERAGQLSKDGILIATDIFKHYPDIKQVTLDTETDEERALVEIAKTSVNNN